MGVRPDPLIVIPTIFARPDLLDRCRDVVFETAPDAFKVFVGFGADFATHCNSGASDWAGDPIVFLNDDTEPQPGWLEALVAPFEDPRIGITGARLTYPDGSIQHAGVYLERNAVGELHGYHFHTDEPSRYVEAVTGACMAVRRECWDQLGGFDTGFVNGNEDVDLCLRAAREGWRIWYCADAHVIHHESASGPARWSHVRQNVQRLQEKHGDHLR